MDNGVTTTAGPAEVARRLYSALAGGDRDTLDEILHPDFVGHLADGMPFGIGGEHRGAEAMRRSGWGGIAKHFAASAEAEQFALLEDGRLLVTGRYRGHGRRGGGAVDATFAHVVTVQDGRITALDQYTDTARWARGAPPYSAIEFEVAGGLATITLNRPKEGNAIDQVICEDLARAATRLAEDPGVRAVLLKANGPMFTAGGDIRVFTATPPERLPAQLRLMIDPYHFAIERLTALDAPLVAAVKGAAAGGGLGLVGMADIVVAAEDAVFTTGYGAIGMTSDGGNSWFLPRLIGMRRTQELYYTNRRLTAAEALDWGLVTSVVPADEVDAEGERIAAGIAQGPTRSFGAIRRLLRQSFDTGLRDQLADEEQTIVDACGTADTLEGVTAFAERRRPTYTGT